MSTDVIIHRKGTLLEAEVDGELVGLQVEKGSCYGFNRSATRIWQLAEQPISLSSLCDRLVDEYEVDRDRCEQEVTVVIRELEREGLLDVSEPAPGP